MTPLATSSPARVRMTAEQFFDFVHHPEQANRWYELVRGEVIEWPPPVKRHGFVGANIARILGNYTFQVGHGYLTGNDSGVILTRDPDTVRGPDVAVYDDAEHYQDLHPKYGEVPPILAVEVLSPSDTFKRVSGKIDDYLTNGVKVVWLVDPEERIVTVYRPGGHYSTHLPDVEFSGDPELPGFRCIVADFFRLPGDYSPLLQPPAS